MFDVYKPGGGIGWATWPLLLAGIAVATGLAFLYQLFLGWVPFIFISALLTCGLGIVLAMLGGAIVNLGHVRNLILAALIGICLTITGVATKFWFQYHHDIDQRTATMMVDNNIPAAKQSQVRELIRHRFLSKNTSRIEPILAGTLTAGEGVDCQSRAFSFI